jgi:hypothetical protein
MALRRRVAPAGGDGIDPFVVAEEAVIMSTSTVRPLARVLLAAVSMAGTAASVHAAGPLPAFEVKAPDGTAVAAPDIGGADRWLLVYVVPASVGADRLVPVLKEEWSDALAAGLVFVVEGTPEEARAYLERKGGAAMAESARWYADPDGAAGRALERQGGLALFGIERGAIDWKLDGVLEDPAALDPVIHAWIERR